MTPLPPGQPANLEVANAALEQQTTPAAPTDLTATPESGRVSLAWTDPSDTAITGYQVRVSDDGGTIWNPDWTDIPGSGATTTSHTVTGLTNAAGYTFELRAVAGSTNGAGSSAGATPAAPLVQNLNKRAVNQGSGTNTVANDAAQAFTTGPNTGGYRLTSVEVEIHLTRTANPPTDYSVQVCNDASGQPGATCDELDHPDSLATGINVFTTSSAGIDLIKETTYSVVLDSVSGGGGTTAIREATSGAEDSGGEAGWSIAAAGLVRPRATTTWGATRTTPYKIAVIGSAKPSPLVKNRDKAAAGIGLSTNIVTNDAAQAFTTGPHTPGYRLTSAILGIGIGTGSNAEPDYSVSIQGNHVAFSDNGHGSRAEDARVEVSLGWSDQAQPGVSPGNWLGHRTRRHDDDTDNRRHPRRWRLH